MRIEIEYVREQLEKTGFADMETCLDEWLPAPTHDKLGTARQAAEIAAALTVFQNGPLDSAAIYDARCGLGDYSSLFNPLTYQPHKAYYAFTAFNELRKRGTAVKVSCDGPCPGAYSAAAKGSDGSLAVMVANPGDAEVPFELEIAGDGKRAAASECRITDDARTDAETPLPDRLPPHSFLVAVFRQ